MEYIEPGLQVLDRLTENDQLKYGENISIDSLMEYRDIIIIGEPGLGKSRLCEELILRYEEKKNSCALFDLKAIRGDLEEYISSCILSGSERTKIIDREGSYYLTDGFSLTKEEDIVICFDALDEVDFKSLPHLIKMLKKFIKKRTSVKFVISCRTHHIERDDFILSEMNFKIIKILPFEFSNITKFLKIKCEIFKNKPDKYFSEKLYKYTYYNGYKLNSNVLTVPRYLDMLAALVNKEGEGVISLGRSRLFEKFIKEKLKEEGGEKSDYSYPRKINYIQRVLEYLALVMEISRSNRISKDDFTTFLFDININLDSQIPLEIFFDRTILKDSGEWFEFDNTEFQEYLAAKAVFNLGKSEQVFFDLAVEKNLKNVYPSWLDVLGYGVELSEGLLLPFVKFANSANAPSVFNLINYIPEDYAINNESEAAEIFKIVFEYHRVHKKWIKIPLVQFLPEKFNELLRKKIKPEEKATSLSFEQFIIRGNIAIILNQLPKEKRSEQWKEYLLEWIKIPFSLYSNTVPQRNSMYALKWIIDVDELEVVRKDYSNLDVDIQKALQYLHERIDPNHKESIKLFFLESKDSIGPSHFSAVNTKEGFLNTFGVLIENRELLDPIISINHLSRFPSSFFDNLKKEWDEDISKIVLLLFKKIDVYSFRSSDFVQSILFLIKKVDSEFVFDLLGAKSVKDIKTPSLCIAFSKLLHGNQIDSFVKKAKNKGLSEKHIKDIIIQMDIEDDIKNRYLSKYAPTEFLPKNVVQEKKQLQKSIQKRQQFSLDSKSKVLDCLENEHPHIIRDYKLNTKWYDTFLEEPQIQEKFIDFVIKYSSNFEFDTEILESNSKNSRTWGYLYFEDAISLLLKFGLKWEEIIGREKMIRHLFLTDRAKQIFEVLEELLPKDIDCILSILKSEEEQLLFDFTKMRNFLDLVDHYNLVKASPILKRMINQESIDSSDFRMIIDILLKWEAVDNSELWKLFDKLDVEEDEKISYIKHVLVKRQDHKAVEKFINDILSYVFLLKRKRSGVMRMSIVDDRALLCENLEYITLEKYADKLLDLLEKSFSKLEEDLSYLYFLEENIWGYIIRYFKKLFQHSNNALGYIKQIKSIVKIKANGKAEQWFNYRISELEQAYLNVLNNRRQSIADSIKKFNELKTKKYIDIAYPDELFQLVKDIINHELMDWVRNGGGEFIANFKGERKETVKVEDFIQKIIVPLLEKYLLARGMRTSDIIHVEPKIYREAEGITGERIDLIINYGPIGSVMVELKRYSNADFSNKKNREKYKEKLKRYLYLTNCSHGIYLVFRDDINKPKRSSTFWGKINEHEILYNDTPNIDIIGIDCHD